jgi:hypothetical protein
MVIGSTNTGTATISIILVIPFYSPVCACWHTQITESMIIRKADVCLIVHALGLYTRISQPCTYLDPRQKDAETISDILLRAASEPEFRNQLVKEPAKILEQYNISPEAKLIIRKSIVDLTQ